MTLQESPEWMDWPLPYNSSGEMASVLTYAEDVVTLPGGSLPLHGSGGKVRASSPQNR